MTDLISWREKTERRRAVPQKSKKGEHRAEVIVGGCGFARILVNYPPVESVALVERQAFRIRANKFRQIKFIPEFRGEFDDAETIKRVHFRLLVK
jgi:hypothetical protein